MPLFTYAPSLCFCGDFGHSVSGKLQLTQSTVHTWAPVVQTSHLEHYSGKVTVVKSKQFWPCVPEHVSCARGRLPSAPCPTVTQHRPFCAASSQCCPAPGIWESTAWLCSVTALIPPFKAEAGWLPGAAGKSCFSHAVLWDEKDLCSLTTLSRSALAWGGMCGGFASFMSWRESVGFDDFYLFCMYWPLSVNIVLNLPS